MQILFLIYVGNQSLRTSGNASALLLKISAELLEVMETNRTLLEDNERLHVQTTDFKNEVVVVVNKGLSVTTDKIASLEDKIDALQIAQLDVAITMR